jgi:hypothetical protein
MADQCCPKPPTHPKMPTRCLRERVVGIARVTTDPHRNARSTRCGARDDDAMRPCLDAVRESAR